MKKLIAIALAVLMLIGLAACSDSGNAGKNDPKPNTQTQVDKTESGFEFKSGDVTIKMNTEAQQYVDALGEALNYFEAESCAFKGLDKTYTYSGFQLNTYPKDGVDYVASVVLTDDSVATAEGLEIGMSESELSGLYPDGKNSGALFSCVKGDSYVMAGLEDEVVSTVGIYAINEVTKAPSAE